MTPSHSKAGGKRSDQCTLILTEGDSAKALAVAGLEIVGREKFGIFPLRGKLLNVRDASMKQLRDNAELKALLAILGLDFNSAYVGGAEGKLRYGKVLIMADQDHDGSHIKGLIINLFAHFWPHLLKDSGGAAIVEGGNADVAGSDSGGSFMGQFVTPIIKAKKKTETRSFSTIAEYAAWRDGLTDGQLRQWTIKYYKGLGTSTAAEAREYFKAFDKHVTWFAPAAAADADAIDKVFNRARAHDRRDWLLQMDVLQNQTDDADAARAAAGNAVHHHGGNDGGDRPCSPNGAGATVCSSAQVGFEQFVDEELVHFSRADNVRSIPNVIDGLKPSQRKVLYSCFKRNLTEEVKVAQFAGYISEHTAYHHGEASLHATIVNMAQDFVGSNNLPLLTASGQFGTRHHGGKDAASPRYIHTHLTAAARKVYREEDDCLLDYCEDDGQLVEPAVYVPVIPMLLVNGAQGIGTGWSTSIPRFNPLDLIDRLKSMLRGDGGGGGGAGAGHASLRPWVRGFDGLIAPAGDLRFSTTGVAVSSTARKFEITELPVGKWTHDYKAVLSKLLDQGRVQSFTEHHTSEQVHFKVNLPIRTPMPTTKQLGLESTLGLMNMHAFGTQGTIRKYGAAEEVLDEFVEVRGEMYVRRKAALEAQQQTKLAVLHNKSRFVREIATGELDLLQVPRSKAESVSLLHERGYAPGAADGVFTGSNERASDPGKVSATSYDYLLNMPIHSFTEERLAKLHGEVSRSERQLARLLRATAEQMWHSDLDDLEGVLLQDPLYSRNRF